MWFAQREPCAWVTQINQNKRRRSKMIYDKNKIKNIKYDLIKMPIIEDISRQYGEEAFEYYYDNLKQEEKYNILNTLELMNKGHFMQHELDWVGQEFSQKKYNMYDALAFHIFRSELETGNLFIQAIPTDIFCPSDSDSELFDKEFERIKNITNGLIDCEFQGGSCGHDGIFKWTKDFVFNRHGENGDIVETCVFKPNRLPIECGYNPMTKTMLNYLNGGIVRWAYKYKILVIFIRNPELMKEKYTAWETGMWYTIKQPLHGEEK